jgi:hypothetical protein
MAKKKNYGRHTPHTPDVKVGLHPLPQKVGGSKGGGRRKIKHKDDGRESVLENSLEFVDPTGVLSYNDAGRAYNDYKAGKIGGGELAMQSAGTLPIIGKIPKALSYMYRGSKFMKGAQQYSKAKPAVTRVNRVDAGKDIFYDNVME